jgi:hypothetical protein
MKYINERSGAYRCSKLPNILKTFIYTYTCMLIVNTDINIKFTRSLDHEKSSTLGHMTYIKIKREH